MPIAILSTNDCRWRMQCWFWSARYSVARLQLAKSRFPTLRIEHRDADLLARLPKLTAGIRFAHLFHEP